MKKQRTEQAKNYGQELESEVFNKLRKNQDVQNEEKRTEMELALHKQREYNDIERMNQERKKQMQKTLASDYENMIKMKQQMNQHDKINDLQKGRMANEKANQELNYLKQSEIDKKKTIREILNNDKQRYDNYKASHLGDKVTAAQEAQQQMSLMEQRQRERDAALNSRYNKFNEFQNKISKSYADQVISPEIQKQRKMNEIIK